MQPPAAPAWTPYHVLYGFSRMCTPRLSPLRTTAPHDPAPIDPPLRLTFKSTRTHSVYNMYLQLPSQSRSNPSHSVQSKPLPQGTLRSKHATRKRIYLCIMPLPNQRAPHKQLSSSPLPARNKQASVEDKLSVLQLVLDGQAAPPSSSSAALCLRCRAARSGCTPHHRLSLHHALFLFKAAHNPLLDVGARLGDESLAPELTNRTWNTL